MADPTFGKEYTLGATVAELTLGLGPNETLLITSATVCNTDVTARTVEIHLASDGAASGVGNTVVAGKSVRAKDDVNTALSGKSVVKNGKIYAGASAAGVMVLSINGFVQPE